MGCPPVRKGDHGDQELVALEDCSTSNAGCLPRRSAGQQEASETMDEACRARPLSRHGMDVDVVRGTASDRHIMQPARGRGKHDFDRDRDQAVGD